MEFLKNQSLINNICQVQIKSVLNVIDIPSYSNNAAVASFIDFYSSPSKITLSNRSRLTDNGPLHNKTLSLSYPGLSTTDFETFSKLIKGEYLVLVKLNNNDIYEITSKHYPMSCTTSYRDGHIINFSNESPIPIKFRENQSSTGIESSGFNYDFNFYLS
ncbi:hypothetical protein ES692_06050 [Psychroserpens burtonensis]|uniref:Uncharacterized protein n=1 Tax=Psychroserpens burtonensis TaxID=49278 RepID=A0A5C7BBP9_9FLAO|nr:hypothetical protein [Psychroserpens burtonensis]TXE18603.1 hypothetical protein ES692_06050 [Psychroserpens burtonensis]